ncbi:quinon protein alcohol dehydrogenase-like superfamily [Obelidium mucronatum]|nr:quinon protein alcohol dehydrogenase-like superfamily [Obelidium mucronatum]
MQGTDASDFFQSDRDIELAQIRERKKTLALDEANKLRLQHASLVRTTSKVLCLVLDKFRPNTAFVGESGHIARKLNLETGGSDVVYRGHKGPVTCVAVEYNEQTGEDHYVFTGSWDKTIKKFDSKTGQVLATFSGHSDFVKSIVLAPPHLGSQSLTLLSGSSDNTIKKWDTSSGSLLQTWKGHTRPVESLVLSISQSDDSATSPPSVFVFSGSSDTSIRKWDFKTGTEIAVLQGHLTSVYELRLEDDDGQQELWSVSADKTVKRWNLEAGIPDSSYEHPDFVKCVCVHGSYVITGCRDENIRVFDLTSEKCINIVEGHFGEVSCLVVAGGRLWSGSLDATIRSWNLEDILRPNLTAVEAAAKLEIQRANEIAASAAEAFPTGSGSMLTEDEERELADLMNEEDD